MAAAARGATVPRARRYGTYQLLELGWLVSVVLSPSVKLTAHVANMKLVEAAGGALGKRQLQQTVRGVNQRCEQKSQVVSTEVVTCEQAA